MTVEKKLVALLPMKANSERVPGKNFKEFAGKPLYRWILDSLLAVPEVGQVVINTDAVDILEAGGLWDVYSPGRVILRQRKAELCGDFISMNLVLADDVQSVGADAYLMTHTTNPLLSTATIRTAINRFNDATEKGTSDSLFAVNKIQTRFYRADVSPVNHDPDNLVRTQDLEPWYEENSNLYLFTRDSFAKTQSRIGEHPIMIETAKWESVDIDEPDDWLVAEAVAVAQQKGAGQR